MPDSTTRSSRLDRAIADLLAQAPEVVAAAVVSFDGLPMASALPATMDEDRVAAMSAALLSLGERAAEGLGRGALSQVYIEGEHGTVFLVSADDEAVLVAVADKGAKAGLMLYEVRRAAEVVAAVLGAEPVAEPLADPIEDTAFMPVPASETPADSYADVAPVEAHAEAAPVELHAEPSPVQAHDELAPVEAPAEPAPADDHVESVAEVAGEPVAAYAPVTSDNGWATYLPNGSAAGTPEPTTWS